MLQYEVILPRPSLLVTTKHLCFKFQYAISPIDTPQSYFCLKFSLEL